jgi:putative oxidoreductase
MNGPILLIARILMAIIFVLAGFAKLTDISGTAAYFGSYNLPATTLLAVVSGIIELVGGLAILIGYQTRLAAWVLAVFCVASALVAHMNWADMMQLINFQKNLAMAGGFLVLALHGAGELSVDARRGLSTATA